MLQQLLRVAACVTILSWAGVAAAQEPATLLLKSGERVSGSLVDMTGSDFVMTVNGQERRVAISDAAVIDFSGSATDLPAGERQIAAGEPLVVLRDGRQIRGRLTDVGGTHPLRISVQEAGQQQDYQSTQVARIYLANPPVAAGTAAAQISPAGGTQVTVAANRQWVPTGITVQRGQTLSFSSSGQVLLSSDANDMSAVTGRAEHRVGPRGSLPTVPAGALIGRIGNGKPFGIGDQASIVAPATGVLYLGVNDDNFNDNSGEFTVSVAGGTTVGAGIRR